MTFKEFLRYSSLSFTALMYAVENAFIITPIHFLCRQFSNKLKLFRAKNNLIRQFYFVQCKKSLFYLRNWSIFDNLYNLAT